MVDLIAIIITGLFSASLGVFAAIGVALASTAFYTLFKERS